MPSNETSPYPISNSNNNDESNSSENDRTTIENNRRHKDSHYPSDNSVFVTITAKDSREKHVLPTLKWIQREWDNFDKL